MKGAADGDVGTTTKRQTLLPTHTKLRLKDNGLVRRTKTFLGKNYLDTSILHIR